MTPLGHYEHMPLISGGLELSKGDNSYPLEVIINPGESSKDIPLWLCTPDERRYDTVVVDPIDIDLDAPDDSLMIVLASAVSGGPVGTWGVPGNSLSVSGTMGPGPEHYKKHWVRISAASGTTAAIKTNVKLEVSGNETLGLA